MSSSIMFASTASKNASESTKLKHDRTRRTTLKVNTRTEARQKEKENATQTQTGFSPPTEPTNPSIGAPARAPRCHPREHGSNSGRTPQHRRSAPRISQSQPEYCCLSNSWRIHLPTVVSNRRPTRQSIEKREQGLEDDEARSSFNVRWKNKQSTLRKNASDSLNTDKSSSRNEEKMTESAPASI